jgi:uncharacterized protein (DUF488 family)
VRLVTVGHGTVEAAELAALLTAAGVRQVVDVRTAPGSRRHPQFGRGSLEVWLPEAGIGYRWDPRLGGFRKPRAGSPHVALRHAAFRGYADHMESAEFTQALEELLAQAAEEPTAAMCSESLWWRCHRRLIADAATLLGGIRVEHLTHDRRLAAHVPTDGVRCAGDRLVYDRSG